ncbi:MAG TPA: PQQ-dependent sugar dehydrogenase, partial [Micromonosporaceae bacterium]
MAIATPRRTAVRTVGAALLSLSVLAGCAFGPPKDNGAVGPPNLPAPTGSSSRGQAPPSVVADVIASGLDVPWGIGFLPDGTALVTERNRRRIVRVGPELTSTGLAVTPVQTITEARAGGAGGLLGLAVSPDYQHDKTIFIYYTTADDSRIARLVLGGRPVPIVTGIPRADNHPGGQLRFGPDGYLYASTGDPSADGGPTSDGSVE